MKKFAVAKLKRYTFALSRSSKKAVILPHILRTRDKKVTVSDYNEENSKKIGTKYNVIAEKDTSLVEVSLKQDAPTKSEHSFRT